MRFLHSLLGTVEKLERLACGLLVIAFTGLTVSNVVLRYIFGAPLYFAEEVSVILMIWAAFIAGSLALGRREMIAVTLLPDMMQHRQRHMLLTLAHISVLAIAATFFYWSAIWITSPSATRDIILTLSVSKWYSYLIVPTFFFLATLKSIANVDYHLRKLFP